MSVISSTFKDFQKNKFSEKENIKNYRNNHELRRYSIARVTAIQLEFE